MTLKAQFLCFSLQKTRPPSAGMAGCAPLRIGKHIHMGYSGPLSVEWEDNGMDREHGAREACEFVRKIDFLPSNVDFDAAFEDK